MKIALIELHTHSECLNSFCKIFKGTSDELTIFTNNRIYDELFSENNFINIKWIIKPNSENIKQYFKKNLKIINRHDIIFITTIGSDFNVFAKLNLVKPTILRIHNANYWLKPIRSIKLSLNLVAIYKDLSYFIRIMIFQCDWLNKIKIVDSIDHLTFTIKNVRNEYSKLLNGKKVIDPIPLALFDEKNLKLHYDNTITISIPGSIDPRRRDYEIVYNVFSKLCLNFKEPVKLIFLGSIRGKYGKKIIDKFSKLQNNYFSIKWFPGRISQSEFEHFLHETDLLLSPIRVKTRYKIYKEVYGKSKFSAIESDIIRYGKYAIIPENYKVSEKIDTLVFKYRTESELEKILLQIIKNKILISNIELIRNVLRSYTKNIVYLDIKQKFLKILNEYNSHLK